MKLDSTKLKYINDQMLDQMRFKGRLAIAYGRRYGRALFMSLFCNSCIDLQLVNSGTKGRYFFCQRYKRMLFSKHLWPLVPRIPQCMLKEVDK